MEEKGEETALGSVGVGSDADGSRDEDEDSIGSAETVDPAEVAEAGPSTGRSEKGTSQDVLMEQDPALEETQHSLQGIGISEASNAKTQIVANSQDSSVSSEEEDYGDMEKELLETGAGLSQSQDHEPASKDIEEPRKFRKIDLGLSDDEDALRTDLKSQPGHSAGRCGLVVGDGGRRAFSCGIDGFIKKYDASNGSVLGLFDLEEEILCLDVGPKGDVVVVGTNEGMVKLINAQTGKLETNITRAPGPIRAVAFSPSGKHIACGTDGHAIRLVSAEDVGDMNMLKGHKAPIHDLAWSPKGNMLVSSSCDGSVIFWKISTGTPVKTFPRLLAKSIPEETVGPRKFSLSWNPVVEDLVAIGTQEGLVIIEAGDAWRKHVLNGSNQIKKTASAAWAPNGEFVISADQIGNFSLFQVTKGGRKECKLAARELQDGSETPIQCLEWLGKSNALVFFNIQGEIQFVRNVLQDVDFNDVVAKSSAIHDAEKSMQLEGKRNGEGEETRRSPMIDDEARECDDDAAELELEEKGKDESRNKDESEEANDFSISQVRDELGFDNEMEFGAEGNGREALDDGSQQGGSSLLVNAEEVERIAKGIVNELRPLRVSLQKPFQPGSSPSTPNDDRYYLAWNSIGSIVLRSESTYNSVQIDFSNTADFRPIRLTDHYGFTMGALSEIGAIFATPGEMPCDGEAKDSDWDPPLPEDDFQETLRAAGEENGVLKTLMEAHDQAEEMGISPEVLNGPDAKSSNLRARMADSYGTPSTVYFRPFNSWSHNAEWTIQLSPHEKVRCVAAGSTFCAVGTNRRILRIVRPTGLQEAPILVPGPLLAMVGAGPFLFVLFHRVQASPDGTQVVDYILYNVGGEGIPGAGIDATAAQGSVPLPQGENMPVKWIGMGDKTTGFIPVLLDSKGNLMALSKGMNWNWVPLLDIESIRRSKHDTFWPVSVHQAKVMAILLKGEGNDFPATHPRPVVSAFPVQLSLMGMVGESKTLKYKYEEEAIRGSMLLAQREWAQENASSFMQSARGGPLIDERRLREHEAEIDKVILRNFTLSLKLKMSNRAFGLARRLRFNRSLQIAHQQARKLQAEAALLNRIERLIELREQEDNEMEGSDEEDEASSSSGDEVEGSQNPPSPLRSLNGNRKRLNAEPLAKMKNLSLASDGDDSGSNMDQREQDEQEAGSSGNEDLENVEKKPKNPFSLSKAITSNGARPQNLKKQVLTPKLNRQSTFTKGILSADKKDTSIKRRKIEEL